MLMRLCLTGVVAVPDKWRDSKRRHRFNRGWPKVRARILERDGYRCQWLVRDEWGDVHACGAPANEVDHKRRDPVHDDDSDSNLWALCRYHHSLKTEWESAEQRRVNRERREDREWYSRPAFRRNA